jgi:hypothetical protein
MKELALAIVVTGFTIFALIVCSVILSQLLPFISPQ